MDRKHIEDNECNRTKQKRVLERAPEKSMCLSKLILNLVIQPSYAGKINNLISIIYNRSLFQREHAKNDSIAISVILNL